MWEYDAFVSYARADENLTGFVNSLASRLRALFRLKAGRELKLFIDTESVRSAALWAERIEHALRSSATLIAVGTPSYLTSEWCAREWDVFLTLEHERRESFELLPYESLVFPVLFEDMAHLTSASSDVRRRLEEMRQRQCTDLIGISSDHLDHERRLHRLVVDLIDSLKKIAGRDIPNHGDILRSDPYDTATRILTTPLVTTYTGADERKLTALLANAQSAVIIGITNAWVPHCLEQSLRLKREREGQSAFWDQLSIVFLDDKLLEHVNDDRSLQFLGHSEALHERMRRASRAKRRIMSLLLRLGTPTRWRLYSHPYVLPFIGNLFSLSNGKRVVQLVMARHSRAEEESLCIDFLDRVDHYFEQAFREIVEASREEHEVVLVGNPGQTPDSFVCKAARFRRGVLVEGRYTSDWLAAVVVVTWRRDRHGAEPLLQVNTPHNSTREIGKASHISGYINQCDYVPPHVEGGDPASPSGAFELPAAAAFKAVARELSDDFGLLNLTPGPELRGTLRFVYPDKENLFFYLFQQEIPASHRFDEGVQMFGWTLDELLRVRRYQVLANALKLLKSEMSQAQMERAGRIISLNLLAHGDVELSTVLVRRTARGESSSDIEADLQRAMSERAVVKYLAGRELFVDGLAGLQYRAFFSHLVPAYAAIGVPGAAELLRQIDDDAQRGPSVRELEQLYNDEPFMESIPIEV